MIDRYLKTKIAHDLKNWQTAPEIVKKYKNYKINVQEVYNIKKTSYICKYIESENWLLRICNVCWCFKKYDSETFVKDKRNKSWLWWTCKSCDINRSNNYTKIKCINDKKFAEKMKQRKKDWYLKNKESALKSEEKRKEKYKTDSEFNKKERLRRKKNSQKRRDKKKKEKYENLLKLIQEKRNLLEFKRLVKNLKAKTKRNLKKILQIEKKEYNTWVK